MCQFTKLYSFVLAKGQGSMMLSGYVPDNKQRQPIGYRQGREYVTYGLTA